jgi:hypothetical protein
MKVLLLSILLLSTTILRAQESIPNLTQDSIAIISLSEYLGYVKSFHPIVKAKLNL